MFVNTQYIRIVLEAHAVKNERTIDLLVPDFLCPYIRRYLEKHRPILLQGGCDDGAIWITRMGIRYPTRQFSAILPGIYGVFTTRSRALIGQRFHPHSTRYSLASTLIGQDPLDVDLAAAALGHRGIGTVERYYKQSGSMQANTIWQLKLKEIRNRRDRSADGLG
jgi:integrase